MEKYPSSQIRKILDQIREVKLNLFGAESHGFRLNPPISEDEVDEFERLHRIALPRDYREFLTLAGNGGAGPFYGVFPLGKVDENFDLRNFQEKDSVVGVLSDPFPHHDEWNNLTAMPQENLAERDEAEYWKQYEAFTDFYWGVSLVNGAIPICHEGCALRILLVVTGNETGFLWEDLRSEFGGLKPVRLRDGSIATFSGWYSEWLDTCTAEI